MSSSFEEVHQSNEIILTWLWNHPYWFHFVIFIHNPISTSFESNHEILSKFLSQSFDFFLFATNWTKKLHLRLQNWWLRMKIWILAVRLWIKKKKPICMLVNIWNWLHRFSLTLWILISWLRNCIWYVRWNKKKDYILFCM